MMTRKARNRRIRFLRLRLLATVLLFLCTPFKAISQSNTDPVLLNVTVTNQAGAAISGLSREDFLLSVNKLPQTGLSFSDRELPASVGILIDNSGSLYTDKKNLIVIRESLKRALAHLCKVGNPANEYFVMAFNKKPSLLQDWTSDPGSMTASLDALNFKGNTAMHDALSQAIPKVIAGRHSKHVLIVVSDGQDNGSDVSFKKIKESLKRTDVLLYAVAIVDSASVNTWSLGPDGPSVLLDFVGISGGRVLFVKNYSNPAVFSAAFELVALELRTQYQLALLPEATGGKEKWHKVELKISPKDPLVRYPDLIVRTRQGYYR